MSQHDKTLLSPFRVLDLADEKGLMCGKILADMGADVIKIEPPNGDSSRKIGPFYHDDPHPEKSIYWFAYNMNKRGITLNFDTEDGQELFKKLAKTADFVIESFDPGYMDSIGLGYQDLEKINPRIIMTSITPFGQTGPYVDKGYKVTDMIVWALGGQMRFTGDYERPMQITFPQAYLNGGAEAATASMIAHYYREQTGKGQHVDVSIQQCMSSLTQNAINYWDTYNKHCERGGQVKRPLPRIIGEPLNLRQFCPCKDGWLMYWFGGGMLKPIPLSTIAMIELMEEKEPGSSGELKDFDWFSLDAALIGQEKFDKMWNMAIDFLKKHTKNELYEEAVKRHILLCPMSDPKDLAEDIQLLSRDFFVDVEHPELEESLSYCGPFAKLSETPMEKWQRAPLIGEHNHEIYGDELKLSKEQMLILKHTNVI